MSKKGQEFTLDGSILGTFLQHRLDNNRDAKIIITSKGSTTGLGKSTLAICIARYVEQTLCPRVAGHIDEPREWNAEDRAFIDIKKYVDTYKNCPKYSGLIIDEIEHGADSRRSMAQDNVDLSHAWAQLRYRNVVSVATLPSVSMLDNRMMELGDMWINVVERGKAMPFYIWVNDFTGKVNRKLLEHPKYGGNEIITWPDLAGDEDYRYLNSIKDQNVRTDESDQIYEKEELESRVEEAKKEKRDEMIRTFYNSEHTSISQTKLGEAVGLSQSMIQVIVNDD